MGSRSCRHLLLLSICICLRTAAGEITAVDVAEGKSASSSGAQTGYGHSKAVDGVISDSNYFWSGRGSNQWWKVNLQGIYFIREIRVYYPESVTGDDQLQVYMIRTESGESPHTPPSSPSWTPVTDYSTVDTAADKYIKYTPTLVQSFRHVAVLSPSNDGLSLIEVQVIAFTYAEFKPINARLVTEGAGCTRFSWDPPNGDNTIRTNYEYRCDNSILWIKADGEATTVKKCHLATDRWARCSVGAVGTPTVISANRRVCEAPSPPRSVSFGHPSRVCVSTRPRWRYTVSWQAPDSPTCKIIRTYTTRYTDGRSTAVPASTTSRMVYANGGVYVTFSVSATNEADQISGLAFKAITTPQIAITPTLCKPTSSSSGASDSWKAVDGDVNTYFRLADRANQWWKVDLGEEYFIREIRVYNSDLFKSRLQQATILLSDKDSPTIHTLSAGADWTQVKNQSDPITAAVPNNYITYDPVTAGHLIPLSRHVAVWSSHSDGLIIAEVNLTAYKTSNFTPTSLNFVTHQPSSCITIGWQPPTGDPLIKTKYEVNYNNTGWNSIDEVKSVKKCHLPPYSWLHCQIRVLRATSAVSNWTRTPCGGPVPTMVKIEQVVNVDASGTEKIKANFSWEAFTPNCESMNSYVVTLKRDSEVIVNESSRPEDRHREVSNLDPFTQYTLTIRGLNDQGLENKTEEVWTTRELNPTDAPSLHISFGTSCVHLKVSAPTKPNGVIIHYAFNCQAKDYSNSFISKVEDIKEGRVPPICGFKSATNVTCSVTASNTAGESPPRVDGGHTLLKILNSDEETAKIRSSEKLTTVLLKPVELVEREVSTYRLIVKKEAASTRRKRSSLAELCQLYNSSSAAKAPGSCYIAAEIEGSKVTDEGYSFTLGNGDNVGGYHNAPLEADVLYSLIVELIVNVQGGEMLRYYRKPVPFATRSTPTDPTSLCSDGCVAGIAIGAAILCLVVVVLGFLYFKRRRTDGKSSSSKRTRMKTSQPKPDRNSFALVAVDESNIYQNCESAADEEADTIPITALDDYISNNRNHIMDQFKVLQRQERPNNAAALLPENKGKCKYKDLYPGDEHRVRLNRGAGPGTDFINASFLDGYKRKNAFIAAQGPIRTTLDDFWLMIWQQTPKAVVMVTNPVEYTKYKCEQYWPDTTGASMNFDSIRVTLESSESWADYVVRTLKVTKDGRSASIKHFHYTSWPDHGVPAEMSPFVIFRKKVGEATSRRAGPMLVHCSAGVGRTGTFIALDNLMAEARDKKSVDVMACVQRMRLRRPCMIQTKEQYLFLHQVLDEVLETETFWCAPMVLDEKIATYRSGMRGGHSITTEYIRIGENMQLITPDYSIGEQELNKQRNRFPHILPDKSSCVYSAGEYINAILVDDYKKQRNVIVTQLPLNDTVINFWRLVDEQEVKVIVQLEHQDVDFYPKDNTKLVKFGEFTVYCERVERKELLKVISLRVNAGRRTSQVTILLIDDWLDGAAGLPKTSSLINYLGVLQSIQQQTGDGKLCITDMDGSTRCGLFVSAYNAVEKLKAEQEVDLYNTVMMVRSRRREFVADIESYVYLYHVLKEFTDAFLDYANFQ